jgi:hypothetical protein
VKNTISEKKKLKTLTPEEDSNLIEELAHDDDKSATNGKNT